MPRCPKPILLLCLPPPWSPALFLPAELWTPFLTAGVTSSRKPALTPFYPCTQHTESVTFHPRARVYVSPSTPTSTPGGQSVAGDPPNAGLSGKEGWGKEGGKAGGGNPALPGENRQRSEPPGGASTVGRAASHPGRGLVPAPLPWDAVTRRAEPHAGPCAWPVALLPQASQGLSSSLL